MRRAPDLRPVPVISSIDARLVFSRWASAHDMRDKAGALARLTGRNPSLDRIYFASTETPDVVKIGWSTNPVLRVNGLRAPGSGAALVLTVVLEDLGFVDEKALHRLLYRFSSAGPRQSCNQEFYRHDSPVTDLMNRMRDAALGRLATLYRVPCVRPRVRRAA